MQIQSALEVRQMMLRDGVIMAYNGEISDELMVTLAEILRNRFKTMGDNQKRARSVFSIFMEQVQNMIWHAKSGDRSGGMIMIADKDDQVTLICGNRVTKDQAQELRLTLETLAAASKESIRQMYRDGMSKSAEHEGPGAGLGLLQIARNSSTPLSFAFSDAGENVVEYFLAAHIV